MAADERFSENCYAEHFAKSQQQQSLPFDADLLCAKLEAAQRERDEREAATRLRRQIRQDVKKDRRSSKASSVIDLGDRTNWYRLPNSSHQQLSWDGPRFEDSKQLWATVNIDIPEEEPIDAVDVVSPEVDQDEHNHILISRSISTDDAESINRRQKKEKVKRRSFMVLRDLALGDRDATPKKRPNDTAKRRSQTLPLFKSKFMFAKQDSPTTCEPKEVPPPSDSVMDLTGFENEYTISFDTCHAREEICYSPESIQRPKLSPLGRPSWSAGEGMRSLLSLSLPKRDKKDRTSVGLEEIKDSLEDDDAPPPIYRRPHTRSQTAPENLLREAAARLKKEEKAKKRRSFGGLLQTILLPNHSMNHEHSHVII